MAYSVAERIATRIGANVRAEMARRGIVQQTLADELDISRQSLSNRLAGVMAFRADELVKVADFLGVPVERLLLVAA